MKILSVMQDASMIQQNALYRFVTDDEKTAWNGKAAGDHVHGNLTNDGKIGSTANLVVVTGSGGSLIAKAAGTTAQFLRGDGSWATPSGTTYTAGTGLTLAGTVFNHTNTVTAGTVSDGGATRTLAFGGTFKIPSVTYDAQGHISSTATITLTMPPTPPDTNTTYTAGNGIDLVGTVFSLGTPGTLTTGTTNSTTTSSHTHAVTFPVTSVAGKTGAVALDILTRGTGLTGNNYNGSAATTWAVAYGTTAGTAAQGNDSRLHDPALAGHSWANQNVLTTSDVVFNKVTAATEVVIGAAKMVYDASKKSLKFNFS